MKFIFKLKLLIYFIVNAIQSWNSEIWKRDPDELYCCSGKPCDECACGGLTVRELYESICSPSN